jgi:HEAT repeat protein
VFEYQERFSSMRTKDAKKASLVAAGLMAPAVSGARESAVQRLIGKIKDGDPNVRTEAWLGAGEVGAPAVKPLADVMTDENLEVARAAKRALWRIVRLAGAPGADGRKEAVERELIDLLRGRSPVAVSREVLWMLSEIGGRNSIRPIARSMRQKELVEDARMVLERIPDKRAVRALKAAFEAVPEEFKSNIAQSLRKRGEEVAGYPCQKLVPTLKTNVKPVG